MIRGRRPPPVPISCTVRFTEEDQQAVAHSEGKDLEHLSRGDLRSFITGVVREKLSEARRLYEATEQGSK